MEYLAHYGVKGQKWGIRRYQNFDGSLTSEGKKRKSLSINKLKEAATNTASSVREKSIDRRRKKTLSTHRPSVLLKNMSLLTEDEYQRTYSRLSREAQLKELSNKTKSRGRKYLERELERQTSRLISEQIDAGISELGKQFIPKYVRL